MADTIEATRLRAEKRALFLKNLESCANASRAAKEAGISSTTAYRWRKSNAAFKAAWDAAIDAALDELESALLKRAVEGVDKPIMYGGKKVATVTHYSDTLAMFLLKARRPEVYARVQTTVVPETSDELSHAKLEAELALVAGAPGVDSDA